MQLREPYFYTSSIVGWLSLLKTEKYKNIVLESLDYLSQKEKIAVYSFVIMPNHIHLVWEMLDKNGKEFPIASFAKHTGHRFLEDLSTNYPKALPHFVSEEKNRKYHFWQRNSLPVLLYNREIAEQKINYIHNNPLQEKWQLADTPEEYKYSSANFYKNGIKDFSFLKDYRDRI